jgi:hypothetical protein
MVNGKQESIAQGAATLQQPIKRQTEKSRYGHTYCLAVKYNDNARQQKPCVQSGEDDRMFVIVGHY